MDNYAQAKFDVSFNPRIYFFYNEYLTFSDKEPPKTEAEKIAAAKKYGILPEEYEAFSPDEHFNYGDYPKIQTIGGDQRSGQVDWDFPELKRNFGEPLDIEFLNYMENRISTEERPFTCYESLLHFLGIMAFFWALYLLIPTSAHPHTKKQLPADGVHYTFEPKED